MRENNIVWLKDGRKLGYAEYGDAKGKPMFFFHGWPTSRLHGRSTDQAAKKLKIRVIATDRPGIGLSDYKPNRTMLDFSDDIVELADTLNIKKFPVLGISGGGPYATVCAYKIPYRLTKMGIAVGLSPIYPELLEGTSWLAKLGWANYGRFPIARKIAAILYFINIKYGPSVGLYRFLFGSKADRKAGADPKIRQALKTGIKEAFRNGYKGVEQELTLYTTDWGFNVGDIKTPVYLWYGEDDRNVSLAMGKYYATHIPNAKLIVYPGEGHMSASTHIEEILKILM